MAKRNVKTERERERKKMREKRGERERERETDRFSLMSRVSVCHWGKSTLYSCCHFVASLVDPPFFTFPTNMQTEPA